MRQRLLFVLGMGVLLGGVAPAAAQSYRFDLGVNGGGSWWSPFVGESQTGSGSVSFDTGWVLGSQATFWIVPRIGLRGNFAFEDRGLKASDGTLFTGADGETSLDHVNLWAFSGDLLFRLKQPEDQFRRGEWLPYIAVGGGIRYVNPAGDHYTAFDLPNSEVWPGVPFGITGTSVDTLFLSELSPAMGLVALGSDIRLGPHFAVRLEVGDRIQKPYAYAVTPLGGGDLTFQAVDGHENDAKYSHDIYGIVGLHLTIGGGGAAAPVAAAPPPPPPPPAQPPAQQPPPPPPAPREESVSVCVIDPAAAGGVRTVSATFLPATRDTMVMVNGQRVAFRTTLPTVTTAENADWLVAGRPLEIAVRPGPARFLPVGQAQNIMGEGSLVRLGTLAGLPIYANRNDVTAVAARLGTTGEIATVLADAEIRRAFDAVQTLYVPYRVVGCAFQPLQRQEEVRK